MPRMAGHSIAELSCFSNCLLTEHRTHVYTHLLADDGLTPVGLQVLDLQYNQLSGSLPVSWSQPNVLAHALELQLSGNRLIGTLPDAWAGPSAFPLLQVCTVYEASGV